MSVRQPDEPQAHVTALGEHRALVEGLSPTEVERRVNRPPVSGVHPDDADVPDRELAVLRLIGEGFTNDEIADLLFLSINSVKSYIRSAYSRLGLRSRSHAVRWTIAHGIVRLD